MKYQIPLVDLKRQQAELKKEVFQKLEKAYDNCEFTYGRATEKFEKHFAQFCKTRAALGVRSGTASLVVTLKALELSMGDLILTTPTTFSATSDAIVLNNYKPVFADVDPRTGNIDPEQVEKILSKKNSKIKAILLVHFHGVPCHMDKILELCQKYKVKLIEDASHAHGSLYKDKPVGSFGLAGCFSLYPSKTLGAIGNAGVITTNDLQFLQKIQMYANHGIKDMSEKYKHEVNGYNELMDNIQAVALNIKLKKMKKWIRRKWQISQHYNQVLEKIGVQGMVFPPETKPSLYVYSLQLENREKFMDFFRKNGINTSVYYPLPLHLQPNFSFLNYEIGDFPNAEQFAKKTVSLPVFPELTDNEVEYVGKTLQSFFE